MDALGLSEPPQARLTDTLAGGLYAITPILPSGGTSTASVPLQPVPAQLPMGLSDFTGRARELDELSGLLTSDSAAGPGAARVVLVAGAGGLGKTTLAVHAAHLVSNQFLDGQLYANLHGTIRPVDPCDLLGRFLRDLGVDVPQLPASEEELAVRYRTRLAGKRVLIVLDNARDAEQVRPLLPGSASAAVLVTSRNHMPDLLRAGTVDLGVLSQPEAQILFGRIAGEKRTRAEPDAAEEVLAVCAGLPLAIRIAGARLAARKRWTVKSLADRLSDERRRLDELRVGNLAVRASFEVSFATLPGSGGPGGGPGGVDPARAFRLLGVWTGPSISLAAAAALLGRPESAVADALDVLVEANLLESPLYEQYRFHDLLRVYAADRARTLESDNERRAAITRVLTWYLHTAEAAARVIYPQHTRVPLDAAPPGVRPLDFASLDEALTWCEAERAELMAATRLATESGLREIAWKLPAASMSFYRRRSQWTDWVASHQVGLANARTLGDRRAEAWMLNNLGMAYGQQRMEESIDRFEEALVICREAGDTWGETRAANNIAQGCLDLGRFGEALAAAQRSLLIQRRTGNRYGEGLALDTLGTVCRALGRLDEAMDHLRQALEIFREVGSKTDESESLRDLGETYLELNQVDDATTYMREALTIRRAIGDRRGEAVTLRGLGRARLRAGDTRQAYAFLAEALPLFEELGDHGQAVEARQAIADILKTDD
jgi:tetratricopeptide (TPR) repeat protein